MYMCLSETSCRLLKTSGHSSPIRFDLGCPKWDMLVPWKVALLSSVSYCASKNFGQGNGIQDDFDSVDP